MELPARAPLTPEDHAWDALSKADEAREAGAPNDEAYWIGYWDGLKANLFDDQIEQEDKDAYLRGHQDGSNARIEGWTGRREINADAASQSLSQEC